MTPLEFSIGRAKAMAQANYEIVVDTPLTFIIRDLGPWDQFPTITNDAERVVEALASYLNGRRLLYYDSEDDLTELVIENGKFAGFRDVVHTR